MYGIIGGPLAELLRVNFETESIRCPIGCPIAKNLFSSF